MSFTMALSSTGQTNPADFEIQLIDPINLNSLQWEVGLQKFNGFQSTYNISSTNNTIYYYNGTTNRTFTLPSGRYEVEDVNTALESAMYGYGDYTLVLGVPEYSLGITASFNTGRATVYIKPASGYTFTFGANSLYTYLGFTNGQVITSTTTGSQKCSVEGGILSWLVHCSLVGGKASTVNGKSSDVMHQFVPGVLPYGFIDVEPSNPAFLQINSTQITRVRMRLSDQDNNTLDLNGENTSFLLTFRLNKNL